MMAKDGRKTGSLFSVPGFSLLGGLAIVVASGCSSSSSNSTPPAADAGAPTFTAQLEVPANSELFKCELVTFPESGYVTSATHEFTAGSHHFLLYTTDLTSIPAGEDQLQDCSANDNAIMSDVRGVFYAAQQPQGGLTYPKGVGMQVTKGQILLLQVHYLNTGSTPLQVNVNSWFNVDTVGTDITQKAGILFWYDPFIHVPAGAHATAQMRCPVPDNITIISAASHYHKRGVNYGAFLDTSATDLAATPFYTSNNWEDPEPLTTPMTVAGGSRIRFQCDYDNTAGGQEYFQGQSATNNEMCMFVASYYPAMDQDTDLCTKGSDMFGSGTDACLDTLSCLGKCPKDADAGPSMPATTADGGINVGSVAIPSCTQQCFVQTCPAFSGTALDLVQCLGANCSSECSGSSKASMDGGASSVDSGAAVDASSSSDDGGAVDAAAGDDGGTDPCTACLEAKCPSVLACSSDKTCSP